MYRNSEKMINEVVSFKLYGSISLKDAIKRLLSVSGWEEIVRDYFKGKNIKDIDQKTSGVSSFMKIPLTLAIMTIVQITGAQTPEELINEVRSQETKIEQQEVSISKSDLKRLEEVIPFTVSRLELRALSQRLVPISYSRFISDLGSKISDAMKNEVLPFVRECDKFSRLSNEKLAYYISEAFVQKINNPKFSDSKEVLVSYLERNDKDLEDVKKVVREKALPVIS